MAAMFNGARSLDLAVPAHCLQELDLAHSTLPGLPSQLPLDNPQPTRLGLDVCQATDYALHLSRVAALPSRSAPLRPPPGA
jgi:hypothetical protein